MDSQYCKVINLLTLGGECVKSKVTGAILGLEMVD